LQLEGRLHRASRFGFNYEAHNAPAYTFNTSTTSFGFGDSDGLSGMDIWRLMGIQHVTLTFDPLTLS